MSSESHASNATCHKEVAPSGPSLFQHGNVVFQTYHVGWLIAGFFTLVATAVSIWLVNKHLQWYTNKREQRYIVRLLFMVPIYAIISFASFLFWNHSTPLLLIRDGYESTVLTAFFYLLLMYLSHDPEEQRAIFLKAGLSREADRIARQKGDEVEKWVFPMGFVKWKPQDGLYFLQLMKWGVLQYCVIRPTTTLAAVIMDYMGLYCEESWGLGWGHIYITIVVSLSVTIAMYCLIQLYIPVAKNLAPHKPILKLFAVKAVVFLTFWQATFLSLLSIFGVVKDTKFMTATDINIGIGALLECFEMTIFAFLHIKAFTYKPYRPFHAPKSADPPPERTPRWRSLGHAMDFRETFREIWVGCTYILDKIRGREPTPDVHVKRAAYYEGAFGRPRSSHITGPRNIAREKLSSGMEVEVEERVDVEVEGERQWLGLGDNYGYGLGYFKRERSDSLEVEIARELQRRGYTNEIPGRGHIRPVHEQESTRDKPGRRHSWWRSAYNRISQTGRDEDEAYSLSARRSGGKFKSRSGPRYQSKHRENRHRSLYDRRDLEDPPPPSIIRTYQKQKQGTAEREQTENRAPQFMRPEGDTLAPLSVYQQRRTSNHTQSNLLRNKDSLDPYHLAMPTVTIPTRATDRSPPVMIQGGPSSPRHPSLLSHPLDFTRSDSLLERVFPANTNVSSSELGHGSESARSLLSTAGSGAHHSKATPKARLVLTTPQLLSRNSDVGILQTPPPQTYRTADTSAGRAPTAMVAEFIERYDAAPDPLIRKGSHFREPAASISPLPVANQDTTPLPSDNYDITEASPKQFPVAGHQPHSLSQPQGLRRNSAQIRGTSETLSRKHRSTLPTTGTVTKMSHIDRSTPTNAEEWHHTSAPLAPSSTSFPAHNAGTRESVDNALSAQVQPSHSGTLATAKYPQSHQRP